MFRITRLTKEESFVLSIIKRYKEPVPEFFIHRDVENSAEGRILYSPFKYEEWEKLVVPEKYREEIEYAPYIKGIHKTIEFLIHKKYVERDCEEFIFAQNK